MTDQDYARRWQKYRVDDPTKDSYLAFVKYRKENPAILDLFVKFAREAKAAGRRKYSMYTIRERIRWHVEVETRSDDGFKFSNNHTPYYARLIMLACPDLEDFFEIHDLFGEG